MTDIAETVPPVSLFPQIEKALLIRSVEERLLSLFAEGKLFGTVHTCIGQEFTGVAIAESLQQGDLMCSNHRGHGHFIAKTNRVEELIAEIMGRQNGVCGGRGGSQHICADGFYSNGIQGGMTAVGAGLALSLKLKEQPNIVVVFIGDGTLGEGLLYETFNIASKWNLPLMVVIENNLYAQSTSQTQTLAGDILARAEAFGIKTKHADTWNYAALIDTAKEAVEYVRQGNPLFFRIDTYRLMAHSKGDDDRSSDEVEGYRLKDPLTRFQAEYPDKAAEMLDRIKLRIDAAVQEADNAPYTAAISVSEEEIAKTQSVWHDIQIAQPERMSTLLHGSLQRNMQSNPNIVIIGEDIEGPYGGAFKVTKNLSLEHPGRVRNTPISEGMLSGAGNGLALGGLIPVVEIMFGDFLTLCTDQFINHASKFRYMYNDKVTLPVILRTPMGGKRGYGATHSQCLEKHFLGLPGTQVLALNNRLDPGIIYDTLFASIDRPTLVIENKMLYAMRVQSEAPEGFTWQYDEAQFPTLRLKPYGAADLTLLCYGGMLPDAEKAVDTLFEEYDIIAEIICPIQLYPLNPWPVIESVQHSGRLIVVEEGHNFAAFGSEVISQMMLHSPGALKKLERVGPPLHPIPSCGPLEKALLPGVSHIVEAGKRVMQ